MANWCIRPRYEMKAPPQSTKKNVKADEILRQKDPGFMAELDALDHLAKDWHVQPTCKSIA